MTRGYGEKMGKMIGTPIKQMPGSSPGWKGKWLPERKRKPDRQLMRRYT